MTSPNLHVLEQQVRVEADALRDEVLDDVSVERAVRDGEEVKELSEPPVRGGGQLVRHVHGDVRATVVLQNCVRTHGGVAPVISGRKGKGNIDIQENASVIVAS